MIDFVYIIRSPQDIKMHAIIEIKYKVSSDRFM